MIRPGVLAIASFVACALFVAEDAAVLAVRSRIAVGSGSTGRIVADATIAAVMIAYNYAASRYVVGTAGAWAVDEALTLVALDDDRRVAAIRNPLRRSVSRLARRMAPFRLLKSAAEGLGRAVERIGTRARRRGLGRLARLAGDLGTVNVLGVPGAGLAAGTTGAVVGRRDSLRHAALFVASWFAGARAIGWLVDRAGTAPAFGDALSAGASAVDATFDTLTDVTGLPGAIAMGLLAHAIVRDAIRVERTAIALQTAAV